MILYWVGMLKVKPNHNITGWVSNKCNVNAVILSSHLLIQCALQAFLLSIFLFKPQEEEESRSCASAGLSETLFLFQI